ncbi:hypothetical protein BDV96DRAFT_684496 [Lophiotrema nucula]|uniref:Uncharacterized protein n=1 Tax=Lophiotrema nucula TaxID=690887 RepID=A0A6A5ZK84_9PLEO|nr:hypothetical protein BDV96DRAFT_684496 [Lophiotrema nucula]
MPPPDSSRMVFAVAAVVSLASLSALLIKMLEQDVDIGVVDEFRHTNSAKIVKDTALRASGLLLIPALSLPFLIPVSYGLIPRTLWAGFLRAAHWILLFSITRNAPWEIATTVWSCAAASHVVFTIEATASITLLRRAFCIAVGLVSAHQTIALIPKSHRGGYWLLLFAIWPMISLLNDTSMIASLHSLPGGYLAAPPSSSGHPIEDLIVKAQIDFAQFIDSQSKTMHQASEEYRRRYLRDPPPGFEKWFAYAKSHDSIFIDEFDMINDDLKPFWNVSPKTLLESIDHVTQIQNDKFALRKRGFTNGEYHGQGGGWIVDDLGGLLQDVAKDLPNVEFAFDMVDEPREIISQGLLKAGGFSKPEFTSANHNSIWEQVIQPCQNSAHEASKSTVYDHGIPFVQDWSDTKDVCLHPEFEFMHGFFGSPETCILTSAPVPILSQGAPSTFADLMYPSPWYTAKYAQKVYNEDDDPPWEQKANNLYWAGRSTGSHSRNGSWNYSHRQRFVKLVQTLP